MELNFDIDWLGGDAEFSVQWNCECGTAHHNEVVVLGETLECDNCKLRYILTDRDSPHAIKLERVTRIFDMKEHVSKLVSRLEEKSKECSEIASQRLIESMVSTLSVDGLPEPLVVDIALELSTLPFWRAMSALLKRNSMYAYRESLTFIAEGALDGMKYSPGEF